MFEEGPLDRFRQRALALASQMLFDPFLVNEAIATLTGSLGTEWVACRADTPTAGNTVAGPGPSGRSDDSRRGREPSRCGP